MKEKLVDFIHVGDYKTGTSWLQRRLFNTHPEIQYLGDFFSNKELQLVLRELVDTRDLDFNGKELNRRFNDHFSKENGKITGISREALSQSNYITGEHARRNAERIKSVFGETKIIYVIREQYSMISSLYSQYIKMGGTQSFKQWFLDPISCMGIVERLKYHKNIQMYHDIFGEDNVLVLFYEELKLDKNSYLEKIYKFIGCSETNFIPKEASQAVNTSLTTYGIFFSRLCNRFFRNTLHNSTSNIIPIDKIISFFITKNKKERMIKNTVNSIIPCYSGIDDEQRLLYAINVGMMYKIKKISEKIKFGKSPILDFDCNTKQKLDKHFTESNLILRDKYLLDVDAYNWTLNSENSDE
jgi:hypothetical protein